MFALLLGAAPLLSQDPLHLEPVPSPRQLAFHSIEASLWVRPGPDGGDVAAWIGAARAAGLEALVLEARDARGDDAGGRDVVQETSEACERAGLRFGVSLASVATEQLAGQVRELLTGHGDVFLLALPDSVPAESVRELAGRLSPETVLLAGGAADVRRVGARGHEPCWYPTGEDAGPAGDPGGTRWSVPVAEARLLDDVIALERLWLDTVGRGAHLALELPLDGSGAPRPEDVERLALFRELLERTFDEDLARSGRAFASNTRAERGRYAPARVLDDRSGTWWATDDGVGRVFLDVELPFPEVVDTVVLEEPVEYGQRIACYRLQGKREGLWTDVHEGTTVGARRVLRVDPGRYRAFRLIVTEARACPMLSSLELYASPPRVAAHAEETVFLGTTRVRFSVSHPDAEVRYTTDGSPPDRESALYTEPLAVDESCTLTARAFVPGDDGVLPARLELRAHTEDTLRAPGDEPAKTGGLVERIRYGTWAGLDAVGWSSAARDETRVAAAIDAGPDRPHARRLVGHVRAPRSGIYGFFVRADGPARLAIGGERILDVAEAGEHLGEVGLQAGWHPVRLDLLGEGGDVALQWRGPDLAKRPLAAEELGR